MSDVDPRFLNVLDEATKEFKSLKELVDEVIPVVEAACEYVDLRQESHHVPVSAERRIVVEARLFNAVRAYQERSK